MGTKRCKKCNCIYPETDIRCPSCGMKRGTLRKIKKSNYKRRPVRTELVSIYEDKMARIWNFLPIVLFGHLGIFWYAHKLSKPIPQKATFIVYYENGKSVWKTVSVGSNKYYEFMLFCDQKHDGR